MVLTLSKVEAKKGQTIYGFAQTIDTLVNKYTIDSPFETVFNDAKITVDPSSWEMQSFIDKYFRNAAVHK